MAKDAKPNGSSAVPLIIFQVDFHHVDIKYVICTLSLAFFLGFTLSSCPRKTAATDHFNESNLSSMTIRDWTFSFMRRQHFAAQLCRSRFEAPLQSMYSGMCGICEVVHDFWDWCSHELNIFPNHPQRFPKKELR